MLKFLTKSKRSTTLRKILTRNSIKFSYSSTTDLVESEIKKEESEKKISKYQKKEKIRNYKFSSYSLVGLSVDIKNVREETFFDWLKIFLHTSMALGFYTSGYPYISPIFCWFASNSVIRRKKNFYFFFNFFSQSNQETVSDDGS